MSDGTNAATTWATDAGKTLLAGGVSGGFVGAGAVLVWDAGAKCDVLESPPCERHLDILGVTFTSAVQLGVVAGVVVFLVAVGYLLWHQTTSTPR